MIDVDEVPTTPELPESRVPSRKVTYQIEAPLGASSDDFIFSRSNEWKVDTDGKIITLGAPGTWQLFDGRGILTRCPKCTKVSYLSPHVSRVMQDGRVLVVDDHGEPIHDSAMSCKAAGCGWTARAYLDGAWGKTLYAIAVMNRTKELRGEDPREIHHALANSQTEAMRHVILGADCIVIAVAPAVGFKVADKHGERLIAEGTGG